MTEVTRRDFFRRAARVGTGALLAPSLQGLVACARLGRVSGGPGQGGYGPLVSTGPELALPAGFSYVMFGVEGDLMSDGNPTPRAHDGMGAFALANGNTLLIRNHEDRDEPGEAELVGSPAAAYDRKAGGGTTSLEVRIGADGTPELVRDFVSLNGTIVNCAGGPTPWGSWLSCEESTAGREQGWEQDHGYVFEVAAAGSGLSAEPLKELGRFVHEAVAVDPVTGVVYETEDTGDAGFYRFIPRVPGRLSEGGRVQMLAVEGRPRYHTVAGQRPGVTLPVSWVDIADPDPAGAGSNSSAVFEQGYERGGAVFSRLEGCWYGDRSVYFHATDGGDQELGQVWRYNPAPGDGSLTLIFESPDASVLAAPDNITVSPRGGLVLCEDSAGAYLRGLTKDGKIFDFARNVVNQREFAGACFGPDGQTLFVNIQGDTKSGGPGNPGMTFAIRGPWRMGAL
ncbi:MAG: alkaline phosphatase PhoX [Longimicrobiaceae bacterium]